MRVFSPRRFLHIGFESFEQFNPEEAMQIFVKTLTGTWLVSDFHSVVESRVLRGRSFGSTGRWHSAIRSRNTVSEHVLIPAFAIYREDHHPRSRVL
jgi:hypothetical protein